MVSATHWLAAASGMRMLERGGNAFDAAAAAGFVLQVVEPHQNGPGGDLPVVFWSAEVGATRVLCAQGPAPSAATLERYAGLDLVPGEGVLAAVVPGAFDGWMQLVRDFGTLRLGEILEPAIGYAAEGFPVVRELAAEVAAHAERFRAEWPSSAEVWLRDGGPRDVYTLPGVAATYRRIVDEAAGRDREAELDAARDVFYRGFVADAIDGFGSLVRGDDLARWSASYEDPVVFDYGGLTVCKPGPWSQGPVFLQQLALLSGFDLSAMTAVERLHTLIECGKLAFADRDALYGDSADVPLETLLSAEYNDERRELVGEDASDEYVPGLGRLPRVQAVEATLGSGEPGRGTCHVDVVDQYGNMVSATPSGGWLHSSPVIPALGWPLGTRAQMFWLEEGLPSSLEPGKRPRTTLSPGLALRDGAPYLAWGTPGGDQQEQWALHAFIRHVDLGLDLQAAIDAPEFHTDHLISSFFPRGFASRSLAVESRFDARTIRDLQRRGHDVTVWPAWSAGRVSAVARERDGLLRAGANARGMQGYAVGR